MFEENEYHEAIRKINEEPFISLTARLEGLEDASEEAYEHGISDMLDQIAKEAAVALVAYHTKVAMKRMGDRGFKILAAAPREYLAWKNPRRMRQPSIDLQTCGIPALRHHLLGLPAETDFRHYERHFFESLPQVRQKALHIYEKHVEPAVWSMAE